MTPRERFHLTMSLGRPDRVPWLEEGLRDDVLKRWESEGLAPGADLGSIFHYDRRERIELDLTPRSAIVLPEDWAQRVQRWRDRDHILELFVHRGLFLTMGVGAWASLEPVLYQIADHPAQVRRVLDEQAQYTVRLIDRVLGDVEVDCASFSEPIGDTHGPMISPAMYREVVLGSYVPIIEALRRHGVRTIVWMTYANARVLLRDVLEAGFDCLWAMEAESTDMDYRALRREFGKSLRLIGGIDLDVLLRDEEARRAGDPGEGSAAAGRGWFHSPGRWSRAGEHSAAQLSRISPGTGANHHITDRNSDFAGWWAMSAGGAIKLTGRRYVPLRCSGK